MSDEQQSAASMPGTPTHPLDVLAKQLVSIAAILAAIEAAPPAAAAPLIAAGLAGVEAASALVDGMRARFAQMEALSREQAAARQAADKAGPAGPSFFMGKKKSQPDQEPHHVSEAQQQSAIDRLETSAGGARPADREPDRGDEPAESP